MNLESFQNPALIWFFVGLICLIAEFAAPGVFIIFFGAGAWLVALLVLILPLNLFFQIMIFTIASTVFLNTFRKHITPASNDEQPDTTDDFFEQIAVVETTVSKAAPGRVRFKGSLWTAETGSDIEMYPGDRVRIVDHQSITLFVKPLS